MSENKDFFKEFTTYFPHRQENATDFNGMMQKLYKNVERFEDVTLGNYTRLT